MSQTTPAWWYGKAVITPALLSPAALAWDWVSRIRWSLTKPYRSNLPVICIGNLTAGGAGKTPAALAIARMLQQEGLKPAFLTRGYGGKKKGPHLVNRELDLASDVGDEPLLLACVAPTVVAANREKGAKLIETLNTDVIIMDDGFQNPGLAKNLSVLVVDRSTGIGNGWIMPSGPLRASLDWQLARAQAVILVGSGSACDVLIPCLKSLDLASFDAEIQAKDAASWLKVKPVIAFAGIGHPEKFFTTLESLGGAIVERIDFPDHHAYSRQDADRLLKRASTTRAQLVTTEKDMIRIASGDALAGLKRETRALPVRMRFKDQGRLKRQLVKVMRMR